MTTFGAQIAQQLRGLGVEVVFGVPGVHNQELYRGLETAGITHVLARHEQGAGFMADGYARTTGKPGVALVISGPGLTNIMTPLGQAWSDSVPLLVIASCLDEDAARRGQLHQMRDQAGAARAVADWSEVARTPDAVRELVARAFAEFGTGRARPKVLHIPIAVLEAPADASNQAPVAVPGPVSVHQGDIETVSDHLLAARRPVFILGGGARNATPAHVRELLTRTGAASFVTYAGRGIVPPDTPLFLGSMLARPGSARLLAQADCIVAIGTELAEVDLWRPSLGAGVPLIRVDLDPEVLAQPSTGIAVQADATTVLSALADALGGSSPDTDWNAAELAALRAQWRAEIATERPGVAEAAETLRLLVPDDVTIASDMTQLAYVAKEVWDMPSPGKWHHPTGFGTLGYGLPAAIGAAVSGSRALAIVGDYGFQYTLQELAVAVELGLPLPILLWDNGKLGEIEASMASAQIAPNAIQPRNPDFLALARAFGADATEVNAMADVGPALNAAWRADGPTLIRVNVTNG